MVIKLIHSDVINIVTQVNTTKKKAADLIFKEYGYDKEAFIYIADHYTKKFISTIIAFERNENYDIKDLDNKFHLCNSVAINSTDIDSFFIDILFNREFLNSEKIYRRKFSTNKIRNFLRYINFYLLKINVFSRKNIVSSTDIDHKFQKLLPKEEKYLKLNLFEFIPFQKYVVCNNLFNNTDLQEFNADRVVSKFIKKYYFKFLPISVINSLKFIKSIKNFRLESINTCSQFNNDYYKALIFNQVSKKLKCRVGQHGFDYGLKKNLKHINNTQEENIKGIDFYYWWKKKPSTNEILNGVYFGRIYKKSLRKKINNRILFVMPMAPADILFEDYISYNNLKNEIINFANLNTSYKVSVKFHKYHSIFDNDKFFFEELKKNGIEILESDSMTDLKMYKYSCVVFGYLSTGFFECLLSKINTRCIDTYSESVTWRGNNVTKMLREEKLIFDNLPKSDNWLNSKNYNYNKIYSKLSYYIQAN